MSKQRKRKTRRSRHGGTRPSALAFYLLVLLVGLAGTTSAQLVIRVALPLFGAQVLSQPINGVFAVLHSWILAGLAVCLLLLAWLELTAVGVGLSMVALVLWTLGLRRHLLSPSLVLYILPVVGGVAAFFAGLRYASGQWLPVMSQSQASKALTVLRKHVLAQGRPGFVVKGVEDQAALVSRAKQKRDSRQKGRPWVVITSCDHAIAVADRLRLKGVRDPGLVFIEPDERVAQVIDLRPQVGPFSVTGRTQDGIEVCVRASVCFQIDAGRRRPRLGEPMPFSKAAAFKAIHAQRVEHNGDRGPAPSLTPRLWDDLPAIRAEHILRDIISKLDFDGLYGPHQLGAEIPRRRVVRELSDRLRDALEPMGIQLVNVDLGNFEPTDPQVYLKRAHNWQTEWVRRITVTQAEGQVERLQILERARADARTELILDLGRKLEGLADSRAELDPDTVLEQFLAVLETLVARPQLRDALPKHTQDVLSDAREAVGDQRDGT